MYVVGFVVVPALIVVGFANRYLRRRVTFPRAATVLRLMLASVADGQATDNTGIYLQPVHARTTYGVQ